MKRALITGITGQDGSYLAELLLNKDYEVHGIVRRSSSFNTKRLDHIYHNKNLKLHYGDVTDSLSLITLLKTHNFNEIYNLAAQSHVKVSFDTPEYTGQVDAIGTLRILESARLLNLPCRIYQASTSELFGLVQEVPQKETTPFYPRSPYGVAKLYAYWIVKNYREAYNMFVCSGILFNHESPRRGNTFVTQKIVQGLKAIKESKTDRPVMMGNLNAMRDWGHAKDYVDAMWLMLQQNNPEDYVIATGKMYSVRFFAELAASYFNMEIEWQGEGLDEIGIDKISGRTVIAVDKKYFRPAEVDQLLGDASKARLCLGWQPRYDIYSLVEDMCING